MARGPSTKQVERFRTDLERLTGAAPGRLGVAVSGGPDSLALLLLALVAYPERVEAATVDHGLRPESEGEARFVAELCERVGVPHTILRPAVPIEGSVQAAARRVRYALLEDWRRQRSLDSVLTAHHADDQAETLLMRLNRGAGVTGLSGVRAVKTNVLRPLLGWRRAELADIVQEAGIAAVTDPSNLDERFDRARLRRQLAEAPWIDAAALAESAHAMAEADEALEWSADRLAGERLSGSGDCRQLDPQDLPPELRRRLLLIALRSINPAAAPRGDELSRLLGTLAAGRTATLAGVKCGGGHAWRFQPAPPRRSG